MRMAERLGAAAGAGLLADAVIAPAGANAQGGRIAAGAPSGAAIDVGYWRPQPYVYGPPLQGYDEPRAGSYTDAAQFWKNYQCYYAGCRRPPVRPGLDWDYVLSCYYRY